MNQQARAVLGLSSSKAMSSIFLLSSTDANFSRNLPAKWIPRKGCEFCSRVAVTHVSCRRRMEDTADDCVDIMVIGRVQKLGDRTQIYMPPTGVSFNLKERKMKLFQKVRWPVVGLLAVKDNLTAVQWALKHMGLSKKQLEALNIEQQI
ncbi:hypothetical protein Vretimale_14354 [Volvox reticuliferus]|uniref:Uncharacterized protein n=1 Tax=Volvox reticuliferus TaxID=1737510 RepID=A0A8J4GNJ9_9CHLO|nr:hypothetical protein Vretifemale_13192 [Volvox reticuliferus]GIM10787.1 hypothetical protein Vretimale_14354 [Volvox reticuliferus]